MSWLTLIGAHWPWAVVVLLMVLTCIFAPAVASTALRWLLGTELGRYLLLAVALTGAWLWYRGTLIEQGRQQCQVAAMAAQQQAMTAAALQSLDAYMAGAKASAAIGATREQAHVKALAERDRTIRSLRAGTLQLRDHWACAVPADATPAAGAGVDDAAELRRAGSGDLVQVGDTADADLVACQAQVRLYQRIGVLRVPPPSD